MTILDDLFSRADEIWNSIQETADQTQKVMVSVNIVTIAGARLDDSTAFPSRVWPTDSLIYNPASVAPHAPATFVSLGGVAGGLTILAPNLQTIPIQPNYQVQPWFGSSPVTPGADGAYVYFGYFENEAVYYVLTLFNLRLQAP